MLKGSCHCGATKFEVEEAPATVTRCTCTYCHKRGALWAYYSVKQFRLLTPREANATYRWNSKLVAHHFCPTCGCGTFTETPDWTMGEPDFDNPRIAINAHLFDELDVHTLPVEVIDGRNLW